MPKHKNPARFKCRSAVCALFCELGGNEVRSGMVGGGSSAAVGLAVSVMETSPSDTHFLMVSWVEV